MWVCLDLMKKEFPLYTDVTNKKTTIKKNKKNKNLVKQF